MIKRLAGRYARALLSVAVVLAVVVPAAPALAAYNPFGHVDCSKASDSAVCTPTGGTDPLTGRSGILMKVTALIAIIAGVTAVVIMVLAGFRYITSNGDAEQIGRAKKTLIYAAVGLVVIVAGEAIVAYVLNTIK